MTPHTTEVKAVVLGLAEDSIGGHYHTTIYTYPPPRHMHFMVEVREIIHAPANKLPLSVGDDIFVAIRFGDGEGLSGHIPGLQVKDEIMLRGDFLGQTESFQHRGREKGMPVLHYCHHPHGYVEHNKVRYS
jgi:hypothetical protein